MRLKRKYIAFEEQFWIPMVHCLSVSDFSFEKQFLSAMPIKLPYAQRELWQEISFVGTFLFICFYFFVDRLKSKRSANEKNSCSVIILYSLCDKKRIKWYVYVNQLIRFRIRLDITKLHSFSSLFFVCFVFIFSHLAIIFISSTLSRRYIRNSGVILRFFRFDFAFFFLFYIFSIVWYDCLSFPRLRFIFIQCMYLYIFSP